MNLFFLHRLLKIFVHIKNKYQGQNPVGKEFSIWKVRAFLESGDNFNDEALARLKLSALRRLRLTYILWGLAGICLLVIVAAVFCSKGNRI